MYSPLVENPFSAELVPFQLPEPELGEVEEEEGRGFFGYPLLDEASWMAS